MSEISSLHTPLSPSVSPLESKKNNKEGAAASLPGLEKVDRLDISRSMVEEVARKTKAFSDSLIDTLAGAKIGLRDIRTLKDSFSITLKDGQVTATGPYKDQIEAFFRGSSNQDEATRMEVKRIKDELKEILALNALIALKEANQRYLDDKKKAESLMDPVKREAALKKADMRHLEQSETLNSLSGTLTFRNGAFTSAALDYIRSVPV